MRRLLPVLLLLVVPPVASAASAIDETASCLRTQPVCGSLSASERDSLTREIDQSGAAPIFIAVLPSGSARTAVNQLHARLGQTGTYGVVAGHSFFAKSTDFHAGPLASAAVAAHRGEGREAILKDFVDRVGEAQSGGGSSNGGGGGSGSSSALPLILLGGLGLGGGALFLNARRQRRLREQRELAEVKRVARD